jgi:hypothetical protein
MLVRRIDEMFVRSALRIPEFTYRIPSPQRSNPQRVASTLPYPLCGTSPPSDDSQRTRNAEEKRHRRRSAPRLRQRNAAAKATAFDRCSNIARFCNAAIGCSVARLIRQAVGVTLAFQADNGRDTLVGRCVARLPSLAVGVAGAA